MGTENKDSCSQRAVSYTHLNRFLNLIYPADREEVLRQTKEQLQSGSTVELEYRVVARDQRIVWVLDKSQLTVGEDGKESLFSIMILWRSSVSRSSS